MSFRYRDYYSVGIVMSGYSPYVMILFIKIMDLAIGEEIHCTTILKKNYGRNGVSNMLMFIEPIEGKRHVVLTDQRTAVDWAHQIRNLVDIEYPRAERIILVMDNLNILTGG